MKPTGHVPNAERQIASERIYEGRILNLRRDTIELPNGKRRQREVVEHAPAVVLIAENADRELLLIEQYRYPVQQNVLELPAGIVEKGESFETAANRELQEETGWRPQRLENIAEVFSSPGFSDELFAVFYATDLVPDKLPEDEDEFIESRFYTEHEVRALVTGRGIADAKTLLGIYWWLSRRERLGESP